MVWLCCVHFQSVSALVDFVAGLSDFPVARRRAIHAGAPKVGDYGLVPQSLDALYNISDEARISLAAVPNVTSQGAVELNGVFFSPDSLAAFGVGVAEAVQPVNVTVGSNQADKAWSEADLDVQLMAGVNPHAQGWFWVEQGSGAWYQFAVHFVHTEQVPQVVSISWSWWEGDTVSLRHVHTR